MTEGVALSLGSNLGDRMEKLREGVRALGAQMEVEAVSSVYETVPLGYQAQGDFLNMALLGRTGMEPRPFLAALQAIEVEQGRERSFRNAPRTLDIDIIFFGSRVLRDEALRVPHPSWRRRAFVLVPLAEIGSDLTDPESRKSVGEVLREFAGTLDGVRRYAPPIFLEESR